MSERAADTDCEGRLGMFWACAIAGAETSKHRNCFHELQAPDMSTFSHHARMPDLEKWKISQAQEAGDQENKRYVSRESIACQHALQRVLLLIQMERLDLIRTDALDGQAI